MQRQLQAMAEIRIMEVVIITVAVILHMAAVAHTAIRAVDTSHHPVLGPALEDSTTIMLTVTPIPIRMPPKPRRTTIPEHSPATANSHLLLTIAPCPLLTTVSRWPTLILGERQHRVGTSRDQLAPVHHLRHKDINPAHPHLDTEGHPLFSGQRPKGTHSQTDNHNLGLLLHLVALLALQ